MKTRMNILLALIIVLILIATSTPISVSGQNQQVKDYTIGPGDVLEIKVWDNEDLDRTVEISEAGSFTFPFIGKVNALNKSSFQIEMILEKRLGDGYLVAPQVSITVIGYKNQKVFIFGEVEKPGVYMLTHQYSLLELISEAGGFSDERGSTCTIVRPKAASKKGTPTAIGEADANEIIEIDIDQLISGKINTVLLKVIPGDSIYISEAEKIYVTGEVKTPGAITWKKGITVREAVSEAGGETPRGALKRTSIIRIVDGTEKELKPNLSDLLKPNDIIKVPQSYF